MKLRNDECKKRLQRHELDARIDWLRDHIKRFESERTLWIRALMAGWQDELREKQRLKLDLAEGRSVSQREVDAQTSIVSTLGRLAASSGRRVREIAAFGTRQ